MYRWFFFRCVGVCLVGYILDIVVFGTSVSVCVCLYTCLLIIVTVLRLGVWSILLFLEVLDTWIQITVFYIYDCFVNCDRDITRRMNTKFPWASTTCVIAPLWFLIPRFPNFDWSLVGRISWMGHTLDDADCGGKSGLVILIEGRRHLSRVIQIMVIENLEVCRLSHDSWLLTSQFHHTIV